MRQAGCVSLKSGRRHMRPGWYFSGHHSRSSSAPFGPELGLSVGGLARGFSPSQISKALNDVSDLLAAKPVLSVSLSSSGAGLDSCNEGIAEWSRRRFGEPNDDDDRHAIHLGPRLLEVHDSRPPEARPDEPSLSNLVEDTSGAVRWFLESRKTSAVDLAVVTQLEAADAMLTNSQERSAMSPGGLLRHRIRRQLPQEGQAYLVESRQCRPAEPSGVELLDKLGTAISRIENAGPERQCFRFAPDVLAIKRALDDERADYVAVSSTAVDPGCFVGDWLKGAYLWDYSLPSYSQRSSSRLRRVRRGCRESGGGTRSRSLFSARPSMQPGSGIACTRRACQGGQTCCSRSGVPRSLSTAASGTSTRTAALPMFPGQTPRSGRPSSRQTSVVTRAQSGRFVRPDGVLQSSGSASYLARDGSG